MGERILAYTEHSIYRLHETSCRGCSEGVGGELVDDGYFDQGLATRVREET
jgi:hypothetical protein